MEQPSEIPPRRPQNVSGLELNDFDTYLLVQWVWPEEERLAKVGWKTDREPLTEENLETTWQVISKGEYDEHGGFRLEEPEPFTHHFVVKTLRRSEDQEQESAGVAATLDRKIRTRIHYHLKGKWWRRRRLTLTLQAERDVVRLSEIVIIGKSGSVQPLSINDGPVVHKIDGVLLQRNQETSIPFILPNGPFPIYLRAFFSEPFSYRHYQLIHPPSHEVKLL